MAPLIVAQAKHETNNFTSHVFKKHRNAFGMKEACHRKQLGTQEPNSTYRTYKSIAQSAKDLVLLYEHNNLNPNINTAHWFAEELRNDGYYTADIDQYSNGIDRFL